MDVFINVTGQKLKIASNLKDYVDGSQDFIRFVFNFNDDTWSDMLVTAQFQQNGKAYNAYLNADNSAFLPAEITEGTCRLLLFGSKYKVKATTWYIDFKVDKNNIIKNASSAALTKTDYEKLVSDVANLISTGKEDKSNKITEFPDSGSPTDEQYPSAKLVYDNLVQLTEKDESIEEDMGSIGTMLRDKIAVLDTFPTTQSQLLLAYSAKPLFIYSGTTSGNAVNGHVYEITRNGTLGNPTYTVTDKGINIGSGGDVSGKEDKSNKITEFPDSGSPTDEQYPSAKLVYDRVTELEITISLAADRINGTAILSKTWVALGDSKTDFNNNGVNRPDNYPYWIQRRNPKITLNNLGSAGGMITNERVNKAGDTKILYPSIYTKATQITGTPDIITVAGGYNDWNWAVTLGTFTTDISGYDTSAAANVPSSGATFPLKNTFYMGVFRLAKYLTERFPTTPILWITPFPTTSKNNGGANGWNVCLPLSDYVQAIKDVCAYFSIPVCDMYTAGGLTPFTSSNLSAYWRNSDGVHPNGAGSKIYSYKIERMMQQTYQDWGKIW